MAVCDGVWVQTPGGRAPRDWVHVCESLYACVIFASSCLLWLGSVGASSIWFKRGLIWYRWHCTPCCGRLLLALLIATCVASWELPALFFLLCVKLRSGRGVAPPRKVHSTTHSSNTINQHKTAANRQHQQSPDMHATVILPQEIMGGRGELGAEEVHGTQLSNWGPQLHGDGKPDGKERSHGRPRRLQKEQRGCPRGGRGGGAGRGGWSQGKEG